MEPPAQAPRLVRAASPETAPVEEEPEDERPAVRLVNTAEADEPPPDVPFPWSPAADRPQRTPPKTASANSREPSKPVESPRDAAKDSSRRPPVTLSADEMSALLDTPAKGKAKEGEA